jgi:hypothetical protein
MSGEDRGVGSIIYSAIYLIIISHIYLRVPKRLPKIQSV